MQRISKILMQRPLEEDVNRISTRSSHRDLYKIMEGHLEDFTGASSRASQNYLCKIMQRPLAAFHYNLQKSFSQGLVKDLGQEIQARTPRRSSQDRHKRTCCCCSGSYKILIQEPPKSLPVTQAPVRHGMCKIFMQGPLR